MPPRGGGRPLPPEFWQVPNTTRRRGTDGHPSHRSLELPGRHWRPGRRQVEERGGAGDGEVVQDGAVVAAALPEHGEG